MLEERFIPKTFTDFTSRSHVNSHSEYQRIFKGFISWFFLRIPLFFVMLLRVCCRTESLLLRVFMSPMHAVLVVS